MSISDHAALDSKSKIIKIEQNKLPGFFDPLGVSEFTVFRSVQKAVYSVRNKPVCEFKHWCVTTFLQGYDIYSIHCLQQPELKFRNEREGNWAEVTFAKASGTVVGDREKNWPIAYRRVPSNNPRNNCGTHFGFSLLPVSKVTNIIFDYLHEALYLACFGF